MSFTSLFNPDPKAYDPYEDFLNDPGKEAFARLFSAEPYFMVTQAYYDDDAKMASRRAAVQIIETIYPKTTYAFDPIIPYMAMTYYDRYCFLDADCPCVLGTIENEDRQLFAICCLTISWKLRDYNFVLQFFLRDKNIEFSTENVLEMELAICRALDWRMRSVTPYLFAGFFTWHLEEFPNAESEIHNLILATQREAGFGALAKRPSVIAAAALLAVASGMATYDHSTYLFMSVIREAPLLVPLEDEILDCAEQMGQLYEPTISNSTAPPRRPIPRQAPSAALQDPPGTGGPAPGQRAGKQPAVDSDDHAGKKLDDDEFEDPIFNLLPRTRKNKAGEGTSSSQATKTDEKETPWYIDVSSSGSSSSEKMSDQKKAGDQTMTNQQINEAAEVRDAVRQTEQINEAAEVRDAVRQTEQINEAGSGGTRKQPACCNIL